MTRTFGAPAGACGRTGQSSFESSYFLAILPLKPAMRGSSAAGFCGWVQPVTSRQPARVPSAKQRVLFIVPPQGWLFPFEAHILGGREHRILHRLRRDKGKNNLVGLDGRIAAFGRSDGGSGGRRA